MSYQCLIAVDPNFCAIGANFSNWVQNLTPFRRRKSHLLSRTQSQTKDEMVEEDKVGVGKLIEKEEAKLGSVSHMYLFQFIVWHIEARIKWTTLCICYAHHHGEIKAQIWPLYTTLYHLTNQLCTLTLLPSSFVLKAVSSNKTQSSPFRLCFPDQMASVEQLHPGWWTDQLDFAAGIHVGLYVGHVGDKPVAQRLGWWPLWPQSRRTRAEPYAAWILWHVWGNTKYVLAWNRNIEAFSFQEM